MHMIQIREKFLTFFKLDSEGLKLIVHICLNKLAKLAIVQLCISINFEFQGGEANKN